MTTPEDPPRWSDGADAPAALGSLLSAAKRDVATDAELSELGARLGPMLASAPAASAVPLVAKLAAGGLIALLGVGGVLALRDSRPAAAPATSAAASAIVSVTAASPGPEPTLPVLPSAASSAALPTADSAPISPSAAGAKKPAFGGAPRNAVDAQAEASLLEQARSALSTNPARALSLAQQHAQQFPRGLLGQEREVIAISALRRLGRTTEAEARAARFDSRYPHSAHQQSVDRPSSQ
ncbi:MAG TPA: hypothetical protein VJV79_13090 [Polyangiaceae bacterium]|nr:hypothetical protein [Polyangiaceae bacterium]